MNKTLELNRIIKDNLNNNIFIKSINNFEFEKYLKVFTQSKLNGDIEIETSEYFAAIIIANEKNEFISCTVISPYSFLTIQLCDGYKLYYYCESNCGIEIKQQKYNIVEKMFSLNFNFSLFIFFIIPILICFILSFLLKTHIDSRIVGSLAVIYFFVIAYIGNLKKRHIKHLEKKREKYLSIYYKGKYDHK